jgi:hypothetical protein
MARDYPHGEFNETNFDHTLTIGLLCVFRRLLYTRSD